MWLFCGAVLPVWGQCPPGSSSVLASGTWHKVGIPAKGIYKIDAAFLRGMGLEPSQIDPRRVQLYGNGGGQLPQANAAERPCDLLENAVYLSGEADGRWDEADYLLFYGDSPDSYRYDVETDRYVYQAHTYADTVYYFFTVGMRPGKRVQRPAVVSTAPTRTVRHYDALMAHETDEVHLLISGREVYGETITSTPLTFTTPWTAVANTTVRVYARAIGRCLGSCEWQASLTGTTYTQAFRTVRTGAYQRVGWPAVLAFEEDVSSAAPIRVTYRLQSQDRGALAYLDYFLIEATQVLRYAQEAFFFRTREAQSVAALAYDIEAPASDPLFLWSVQDPTTPESLVSTRQGGRLSFVGEGMQEYALFRFQDAQTPPFVQAMAPQNLKGGQVPHVLILTAAPFFEEAQRLAAFRREHDRLDTRVTLVEEVYHEFSSGMPDVSALRDYVRYLYSRDSDKLRYLILFGSCSYDIKNVHGHGGNYVPTYESYNSLVPAASYASDDYYGFLEEDEGAWEEDPARDHTLDIGIGRLPVRSVEEAGHVVDKLIAYANSPQGPWQRNLYFVSDDGDRNVHQRDAETLSDYVNVAHPRYESRKLYLDAFEQENDQGLQRSTATSQALLSAIEQGALMVNFTGHGNTQVWTAEQILTRAHISALNNAERLPLFITATCDFGRYDDPVNASSGEALFTYPLGGGIALFTASRPVYGSSNYVMNDAIFRSIFEPAPSGEHPRLGDVFRRAKNNSLRGINNRSFVLLGDPSLRLAYPRHEVALTRINDIPVEHFSDTLRAFSVVQLEGEVRDYRGMRIEDFEGLLRVDVYDKSLIFSTRGDQNPTFAYTRWESTLFRGEASVAEGRFRVRYQMPRSLAHNVGRGRMAFYAQPRDASLGDAAGAYIDAHIGLSLENPPLDRAPPQIEAYLNEAHFVAGSTVAPKPILYIQLQDESGIKLSEAGLGKHLSFTLDGDTKIRVDDRYLADKNTYQSGRLSYPLERLENGRHTLFIEAWDNYDNKAEYSFHFYVSTGTEIQLRRVMNYPNPMTEHTMFCFEHDKRNDILNIALEIFDKQGQKIHTQSWRTLGNSGRICNLAWKRTLPGGTRLPADLYMYRLRVSDEADGTHGEASGRLVIED